MIHSDIIRLPDYMSLSCWRVLGCFGPSVRYWAGQALDISVWFRLCFYCISRVIFKCFSSILPPSLSCFFSVFPYLSSIPSFFSVFGCVSIIEQHKNTLAWVFRACWHTVFCLFEVLSLLMLEIERWSGMREEIMTKWSEQWKKKLSC